MLALKGWNTSKSRRTQTMLLPAESLKLTAVSSLSGSRGLRNTAALMLFAIESHSSSQRPCPNQSMKPTAPFRNKFSVFAMTPAVAYLCLVRRLRSSRMSISQELERLAKLHADGALSDEEFTKAKSQLLAAT